MTEYHKIENIFERDITTNKLIIGKFKSNYLEVLATLEWIATEKVDGTNIRIIWENNEFRYGGKTDRAQFPKGFEEYLQATFEPLKPFFLEKFADKKVCFYGEGYGAGIQKGDVYRPDKAFVLFDIWCEGVWFNRGAVEEIARQLEIEVVPIVARGNLLSIVDIVKNGLPSQWNPKITAEGVVARPVIELFDNRKNRIIVKIKNRDF